MFRNLARTRTLLLPLAAAALLACAMATNASAGTTAPKLTISPGPYTIAPATYWTTFELTCPAGGASCKGVASLDTAYAIKPYDSRPKAKAQVADVAYAVPAGTTKAIKARVYGPALAQAMKQHSVVLLITAWEPNGSAPAAKRIVTFTLAHR